MQWPGHEEPRKSVAIMGCGHVDTRTRLVCVFVCTECYSVIFSTSRKGEEMLEAPEHGSGCVSGFGIHQASRRLASSRKVSSIPR